MVMQPVRHRFTVDEYYRMSAAGVFGEDDRVELLDGEVVEMAAIGSRHAACVNRLTRLFASRLGDSVVLSIQNPIRLSNYTEPQPDVALLAPRADLYGDAHATPPEVELVIEVADTTAAWDRGVKAGFYARAGVRELWVVDLPAEALDVFRDPGPSGYGDLRRYARGERVDVAAMSVAIDEILG